MDDAAVNGKIVEASVIVAAVVSAAIVAAAVVPSLTIWNSMKTQYLELSRMKKISPPSPMMIVTDSNKENEMIENIPPISAGVIDEAVGDLRWSTYFEQVFSPCGKIVEVLMNATDTVVEFIYANGAQKAALLNGKISILSDFSSLSPISQILPVVYSYLRLLAPRLSLPDT